MRSCIVVLLIGLLGLTSCGQQESAIEELSQTPTVSQQKLLDEGWTMENPGEDLSEDYGIKPVYGIQDNYFDITIGDGFNAAVKIMDVNTDQCIRYVYVAENSTTTVQEIPQGVYYLKLAYGYDWMENVTDSCKVGKFTRNTSFEKSMDTFDFGKKNSTEAISFRIDINVVGSDLKNTFMSKPISEEEFMR